MGAEVHGNDDLVDVADAAVVRDADAPQLARARPALHLAVVVAARLLAELRDEVAVHVEHPRPVNIGLRQPVSVPVLHARATQPAALCSPRRRVMRLTRGPSKRALRMTSDTCTLIHAGRQRKGVCGVRCHSPAAGVAARLEQGDVDVHDGVGKPAVAGAGGQVRVRDLDLLAEVHHHRLFTL